MAIDLDQNSLSPFSRCFNTVNEGFKSFVVACDVIDVWLCQEIGVRSALFVGCVNIRHREENKLIASTAVCIFLGFCGAFVCFAHLLMRASLRQSNVLVAKLWICRHRIIRLFPFLPAVQQPTRFHTRGMLLSKSSSIGDESHLWSVWVALCRELARFCGTDEDFLAGLAWMPSCCSSSS